MIVNHAGNERSKDKKMRPNLYKGWPQYGVVPRYTAG